MTFTCGRCNTVFEGIDQETFIDHFKACNTRRDTILRGNAITSAVIFSADFDSIANNPSIGQLGVLYVDKITGRQGMVIVEEDGNRTFLLVGSGDGSGTSQPTAITSDTLAIGGSGFNRSVDLTPEQIALLAKADTAVQKVVAGTNIDVDDTDPNNPVISVTGGGTGSGTSAQEVYDLINAVKAGTYEAPDDLAWLTAGQLIAFRTPQLHAAYDELMEAAPDYITRFVRGHDRLGNEIREYIFKPTPTPVVARQPVPVIALVAALHGNERDSWYGTMLLMREIVTNWKSNPLLEYLRFNVEIRLIPAACPNGIDANTRLNHRGVDLNRNFSVGWAGWDVSGEAPLSELEAQVVHTFLIRNVDSLFYMDIHNIIQGPWYEWRVTMPVLINLGAVSTQASERSISRRVPTLPAHMNGAVSNVIPGTVNAGTSRDFATSIMQKALVTETSSNASSDGGSNGPRWGPFAQRVSMEHVANSLITLLRNVPEYKDAPPMPVGPELVLTGCGQQRIDLELIPNDNWDVEMEYRRHSEWVAGICHTYGTNHTTSRAATHSIATTSSTRLGNVLWQVSLSGQPRFIGRVRINKDGFTLNDIVRAVAATSEGDLPVSEFTAPNTALLFGARGTGTSFSQSHTLSIRSFRIREAGVPICDMVTVRRGSTEYSSVPAPANCMWCKVRERYFVNNHAVQGEYGLNVWGTNYFIFDSAQPPVLENAAVAFHSANLVIYVPDEHIDTWRAAPVWSEFADYIRGVSEFNATLPGEVVAGYDEPCAANGDIGGCCA